MAVFRWFFAVLCLAHASSSICTAFAPSGTLHGRMGMPSNSMLFLSDSNFKSNQAAAAATFELSELKLNLRSMEAQKLTTANQIEPSKRGEIEGYIRQVVNRRQSIIPLSELGRCLPGTKWRLSFSTQGITNQSLPPGASIHLEFLNTPQNQQLNYCLEFTKTLGLSKLTALSSYEVEKKSMTHPGWVTYVYQDVQTDVFGLRGVGIPVVGGFLKGRTAVIQTVYFDGQIWIERGNDEFVGEYFQLYTRLDDDTDGDDDDDSWQT